MPAAYLWENVWKRTSCLWNVTVCERKLSCSKKLIFVECLWNRHLHVQDEYLADHTEFINSYYVNKKDDARPLSFWFVYFISTSVKVLTSKILHSLCLTSICKLWRNEKIATEFCTWRELNLWPLYLLFCALPVYHSTFWW